MAAPTLSIRIALDLQMSAPSVSAPRHTQTPPTVHLGLPRARRLEAKEQSSSECALLRGPTAREQDSHATTHFFFFLIRTSNEPRVSSSRSAHARARTRPCPEHARSVTSRGQHGGTRAPSRSAALARLTSDGQTEH
ncbi:hypothetical protein PHYPO_G00171690 [Pangasianodon hypophthalmus]|uniref:Uncharacterized protein n=1 Tax=Pangasianodon hypophthalmus TaxID=310915 RepID=A0A5N5JEX3_PANHP|nr:hypothetical protein PHYPO_G00171690 [Pangasianodon hypophthalmus]